MSRRVTRAELLTEALESSADSLVDEGVVETSEIARAAVEVVMHLLKNEHDYGKTGQGSINLAARQITKTKANSLMQVKEKE